MTEQSKEPEYLFIQGVGNVIAYVRDGVDILYLEYPAFLSMFIDQQTNAQSFQLTDLIPQVIVNWQKVATSITVRKTDVLVRGEVKKAMLDGYLQYALQARKSNIVVPGAKGPTRAN